MPCPGRSFVSVLPIIVVCVLHHQARARICRKIVPGVDKLQAGVDITKLDLLPVVNFEDKGFRSNIIDYTCTQGATKTIDGTTYDVPDQVDSVITERSGQQNSQVHIIKSESQIKDSLSVSVGIGVETGKFGFSASTSYSKMQETIAKQGRFVSQVSAVYGTSIITLNPHATLSRSAQQHLSELPPAFDDDPSGYYSFIETFGTHYFTKGRLGGMLLMTAETNTSFFQNRDDQTVSVDVQATFFMVFSVNSKVSTQKSRDVSEFKKASKITYQFYGGNTNLATLAEGGLSKWQPTIAKLPYFMSGSLRTISSLIMDEDREEAMNEAVKNYLLRAKVTDLERLARIRTSTWLDSQSELEVMMTQLQELKTKTVYSQEDEDQLENIENQVRVPEWFTEGVSFCFKSVARSKGPQCNEKAVNLQCVTPNQMTANYFDKTYLNDAGCRMNWKISAGGSPEWFKAVKLVFRWYPMSSSCACGPVGVPFTLSAPAGVWTKDYLDVTNRKYGKCTMQWMIEVPTSAPVWARNIELCSHFTCGGRRECVLANHWTRPYLDSSTRRPCGMSWGFKIN